MQLPDPHKTTRLDEFQREQLRRVSGALSDHWLRTEKLAQAMLAELNAAIGQLERDLAQADNVFSTSGLTSPEKRQAIATELEWTRKERDRAAWQLSRLHHDFGSWGLEGQGETS
jgi:hypothetical protein